MFVILSSRNGSDNSELYYRSYFADLQSAIAGLNHTVSIWTRYNGWTTCPIVATALGEKHTVLVSGYVAVSKDGDIHQIWIEKLTNDFTKDLMSIKPTYGELVQ